MTSFKQSNEMDLEDWELLPDDDKSLQIHDDDDEEQKTEFVDMKVKSPEFDFQYEEKCEVEPKIEVKGDNLMEFGLDLGESDEGGLDLLKFGTGIGAICSFGITAATICIVLFSSHRKRNKNQKLQFQIFNNDKRVPCEHAK